MILAFCVVLGFTIGTLYLFKNNYLCSVLYTCCVGNDYTTCIPTLKKKLFVIKYFMYDVIQQMDTI